MVINKQFIKLFFHVWFFLMNKMDCNEQHGKLPYSELINNLIAYILAGVIYKTGNGQSDLPLTLMSS